MLLGCTLTLIRVFVIINQLQTIFYRGLPLRFRNHIALLNSLNENRSTITVDSVHSLWLRLRTNRNTPWVTGNVVALALAQTYRFVYFAN